MSGSSQSPIVDFPWWREDPPIRAWDGPEGVLCAIAAGGGMPGLNGYVRLPGGHPWRDLDLQSVDYEVVEVHGGITFGPTSDGWIGFDTGHGGDVWAWPEVEPYLDSLHPQIRDSWLDMRERGTLNLLADITPWTQHWTLERVVVETERLAAQVAANVRGQR